MSFNPQAEIIKQLQDEIHRLRKQPTTGKICQQSKVYNATWPASSLKVTMRPWSNHGGLQVGDEGCKEGACVFF